MTSQAVYTYYDDDGLTYNFVKGEFGHLKIEILKDINDFKIQVEKEDLKNMIKVKKIHFELYDENGNVIKKDMVI